MNEAITHRNEIEALPAVMNLRQACETLRLLDNEVSRQREDARIVLARAYWHLENQITEIYARFISEIERKESMSQMSLGLPVARPTSPMIGVSFSREIHPEDTKLFEASYSYAVLAIGKIMREFPFLPPADLTKIQKVIQDRYRQWIIGERSFCMCCGSPRITAIEDDHGNNAFACQDCKALNEDADLVKLGEEEREHALEAA